MKIVGIIPARFESTRLPGKPLLKIGNKTMIQRVYEQCIQAKKLDELIIATDNDKILKEVEGFGGKAILTSSHHKSGTDRCAEVSINLNADFIINIQGDEPFINPQQIDDLANILTPDIQLATQVKKIDNTEDLFDQNSPKVVINNKNKAIYFSRQTIPFVKGVEKKGWLNHHKYYKHIGMYAYRKDILNEITQLPISTLEKAESLEQLRWLENGYFINVQITKFDSFGIDTPEDLEKAVNKL